MCVWARLEGRGHLHTRRDFRDTDRVRSPYYRQCALSKSVRTALDVEETAEDLGECCEENSIDSHNVRWAVKAKFPIRLPGLKT